MPETTAKRLDNFEVKDQLRKEIKEEGFVDSRKKHTRFPLQLYICIDGRIIELLYNCCSVLKINRPCVKRYLAC